jgi:hypothetical protein
MSTKLRLSTIGLLILIAALLYTLRTDAQQQRGNRGQAPGGQPAAQRGGGRGAQAEPPLWLPDEDFVHWPLPEGDQAYAKIDGYKIKNYINEITTFSRKSRDDGNQFWGRITGTPYDKMTTDWIATQFRRIGLEQVYTKNFDLPPQWIPSSWEVVANGGGKSVPIKTAFPLYNSVASKQIELEPVWAGMGTEADFMGRDIKGKAVIVYGFPNPGGRSDTALSNGSLQRAEAGGAAAILVTLGMPGNITNEPQAGGTTPPASVPVFMIGNDDSTTIREMIEKKQSPRISLRLDVTPRTGLQTASVFGTLPGMTDENILVMAHTESFFEGAMDNASGVATMITLAEYYASIPKSQRKRTMVFFTSSAHHAPSGDNAGLRWIHLNMQPMFAKAALLVNCEHTAQVATYMIGNSLIASNLVSARRWYVGGSDQLKGIFKKAAKDYGMALHSRPEVRPGGELGQVFTDAPSVHIIDSVVYHTDLDDLKVVPAYGLEQSARFFLRIIDSANKLDLASLRQNIPTQ